MCSTCATEVLPPAGRYLISVPFGGNDDRRIYSTAPDRANGQRHGSALAKTLHTVKVISPLTPGTIRAPGRALLLPSTSARCCCWSPGGNILWDCILADQRRRSDRIHPVKRRPEGMIAISHPHYYKCHASAGPKLSIVRYTFMSGKSPGYTTGRPLGIGAGRKKSCGPV